MYVNQSSSSNVQIGNEALDQSDFKRAYNQNQPPSGSSANGGPQINISSESGGTNVNPQSSEGPTIIVNGQEYAAPANGGAQNPPVAQIGQGFEPIRVFDPLPKDPSPLPPAQSSGPGKEINGSFSSESLSGTGGNDYIRALGGNDKVAAGAGNDVIVGGKGGDIVDGGAGSDTAIMFGNARDWQIREGANGETLVRNLVTGEQDVLYNVEFLQFRDRTVPLK